MAFHIVAYWLCTVAVSVLVGFGSPAAFKVSSFFGIVAWWFVGFIYVVAAVFYITTATVVDL